MIKKEFWKDIPQMSFLVIILSLVKTFLFYSNFNVPIKYFLGVSELMLAIADDLLLLLVLQIMMSLVAYATLYFIVEQNEEESSQDTQTPDEKKKENFQYSLAVLCTVVVMVTCMVVVSLIKMSFSDRVSSISIIISLGYILILGFKGKEIVERTSKLTLAMLFSFYISLSVFGVTIGTEIDKVSAGRYKGTIIKTADTTYTSTDSSFFIGKTEKYVFIYNKRDTTTEIIPSESITKFILKKR